MAKSSMIARERKRQKLVDKYAAKRVELKKLAKDGDVEAQIALDKLPKDSSPVRLHNRCRLTGRPRGYMRRFGICRVVFREMANDGKIPGVTKSSW
ncbi:30S ribosomal protein S14 [Bernardetia sp. Wsw4-3y2]|uniref:30S ribosomal protein S14 n=1 Tax=unclassified Bernardetia TaxID=2647129 RepID=UPI0030D5BE6D